MWNLFLACLASRVGLRRDPSRVLVTFLGDLKTFIEIVTYCWGFFSLKKGMESCFGSITRLSSVNV